MTSEHRSPEEIESEIERDRAGLTSTLDDLQDRLSLDGLMTQMGQQVRLHGGDIGASVARAIKENPLPLVLTGAGLVWLMASSRNASSDQGRRSYDSDRRYDYDKTGYDRRSYQGRSAYGAGYATQSEYEPRQPSNPSWVDRADGYRVSSSASQSDDDLGHKLREGRDALADKAKDYREKAYDLGERAMDSFEDMREYLSEGTESFTEEARERIQHARLQAVKARRAAMRQFRQGRDRTNDMLSEHPIMTGAFGLALGAALGAALPRTRTEDRTLGEYSDALIRRAEQLYHDEKSKLADVADAAMDEAKSVAGDVRAKAKDSIDAAAEEAREGAKRVADAAKAEADRKNLAKPDM